MFSVIALVKVNSFQDQLTKKGSLPSFAVRYSYTVECHEHLCQLSTANTYFIAQHCIILLILCLYEILTKKSNIKISYNYVHPAFT